MVCHLVNKPLIAYEKLLGSLSQVDLLESKHSSHSEPYDYSPSLVA